MPALGKGFLVVVRLIIEWKKTYTNLKHPRCADLCLWPKAVYNYSFLTFKVAALQAPIIYWLPVHACVVLLLVCMDTDNKILK